MVERLIARGFNTQGLKKTLRRPKYESNETLVPIVLLHVVQKLDGAIHKLNQYLVNKHYISIEQLGCRVGIGKSISLLTANVFLLFTYLFVNRKHEKLADKEF